MHFQSIPIVRIFDIQKAKAFYIDYLGMKLDWEHRFEAGYPLYMQVSKDNFVLHLSEHSGDGSPGIKLFVKVDELVNLFDELNAKEYAFCNPHLEDAPWGGQCFTVIDPFSNRILFNNAN